MKAAIVGSGVVENYNCFANELKKCDIIICADGGIKHLINVDIPPNVIVGDFDSLPVENRKLLEEYPNEIIYRLPCEKDDTDTLAAIRMAVEMGYEEFVIYGGLGGRLSHTIANIQCLMFLKEQGLYGELVGNGSRILVIKDEKVVIPAKEKGYVSVFAYSEKTEGVMIKNLKYEVEDAELANGFPIGVSNEFVGMEAEISVKKGTLLVVVEA